MISEMIKAAMVNFIPSKIRHIAFLLTKETIQRKIKESCLLKSLSQDSSVRMLTLLNRSGWNLYPCFWSKGMLEDEQMVVVADVSKDLLFHQSHY